MHRLAIVAFLFVAACDLSFDPAEVGPDADVEQTTQGLEIYSPLCTLSTMGPKITLVGRTETSLTLRADIVNTDCRWQVDWFNLHRSVEFTWPPVDTTIAEGYGSELPENGTDSGLIPGREYCYFLRIHDGGRATGTSACFRTKALRVSW